MAVPIRPCVSEKTYNKIVKIADLPVDIPFDKVLSIAIKKLENSSGKRK